MKKTLAYVFGSLVIAAVGAEVVIRVAIALHAGWVSGYSMDRKEEAMLHDVWDSDYRGPVAPPFAAFSNRGDEDPERLKAIYPFSHLPPGLDVRAPDFLLPAGASSYQVRSTPDGFRDNGVKSSPSGKVFRVLCLGTYMTFGEGVDDQETLPSRLQAKLHEKLKRPVEVLNGGLNASTAIMGLARLTFDGKKLRPDLIILQYGVVDSITSDLLPVGDPRIVDRKNFVFRDFEKRNRVWNDFFFGSLLRHSYVAYDLQNALAPWIIGDPHWEDEGFAYFGKTMAHLVKLAKETAPSVIVLVDPQPGREKINLLNQLGKNENVPVFHAIDLLTRHAALFGDLPDWTREYDESRSYYDTQRLYGGVVGAFRNVVQLNAKAYDVIADELTGVIAPLAK